MFRFVAVALVAGASTLAAPLFNSTVTPARGCATHITSEQMAQAEARFASRSASLRLTDAEIEADAIIPVVWHVISAGDTLAQGNVPQSQVDASIADMNTHFANTHIQFVLQSTNRVTNADWFTNVGPDNSQQTAMKTQLRVGDAATLNVYSVGFQGGSGAGLLGYATFPDWYAGDPKDDGVVILYSSVPGGTTGNYNEGKTLTHEVGHWIGLYHVFQGGCSGSGDFVDDTPPQRTATNGCPASQDSCTGGGVDSIHNFMDYSYDSCMWEWSAGQLTRARAQIKTYRSIDVPVPSPSSSSTVTPTSTSTSVPPPTTTTTTTTSPKPTTTTFTSTSTKPTPTTTSTSTKGSDCPWWWPWCWFKEEELTKLRQNN